MLCYIQAILLFGYLGYLYELQFMYVLCTGNFQPQLITELHGMQTRSYDENSVRPSVRLSVCPSVKRVHCDKTEERHV